MCDYSLAGIPNRLAKEGERLMVCRFSTGSIGLTSGDGSLWEWWFKQTPAVCVPPGARLLLRDIPRDLQCQFDVQATEEVTFVQLSAVSYEYRDAAFQKRPRGSVATAERQRVEVLSLCSGDSREAEHQQREEEYRRVFCWIRSAKSAVSRSATRNDGSGFAKNTCIFRATRNI